MSEEEKEIIREIDDLLEFMEEELEAEYSCFNKREYQAVKGLLDLYEKEKEKNNKAIEYLESCRTSSGNYLLFLSETEYLLEILKGK